MKIAVVCDSFKGSLTSKDACAAVKDGLLRCNKNFEVLSLPFADGGEGTSRCFYDILGGQIRKAAVHDPLLREITAEYTVLPDGTAVIDIASASGLTLLKSSERDAVKVSSLGSGELICDAAEPPRMRGRAFCMPSVCGSFRRTALRFCPTGKI